MALIKAVVVYAPTFRMRARLIKTFDAAMLAKKMIRPTATKFVAGQVILAFEQLKIVMGDDQVQESGSRTNGAIAVQQLRRWSDMRLETN